jgi:putative membrane protein insertion efficiency factor
VTATLLCVAAGALLARDFSRPPERQATSRAALSAIRWYQANVSGHLGVRCRFTPSCSKYAITVIERHGFLGGGWRAARRLARCGPWTPMGTVDTPQ